MAVSSNSCSSGNHGIVSVIFCLLLAMAVIVKADSPESEAFLLVHKKSAIRKVKAGEEITISFDIHNAGGVTAYDISLADSAWPADIFDIEGNTTKTWEKLEAGGKPLQHSFLLKSKVKGPFVTPPAAVKYRITSRPELQVALSNPLQEIDVLSDKPDVSPLLWLKELAAKFGPLVSCSLIVILFAIVVTTPTKPKKNSRSGKKKR